MPQATVQPGDGQFEGNGAAATPEPHSPPAGFAAAPPIFPWARGAERELPPLHAPAAMPVARDRWERLVTAVDVPAAPAEVWRALTDPEALRHWLALCHGSLTKTGADCVLDFEDGEFFLCRPADVEEPRLLRYYWRWLGIGQATAVSWRIEPTHQGADITVTEEAVNPPWDWQTWNGGGWPGILDQLAAYLRTGTDWRWPWRRMGPYTQIELPVPLYEAWDRLFAPHGLKYWLLSTQGAVAAGQTLTIFMGDASGLVEMKVGEVVGPGESPPSFLPHVTFTLARKVWGCEVGGRLWIEPAGWGRSLLQVFHYNWENLPAGLQLSERKILTSYWVGAARRALQMCSPFPAPGQPPQPSAGAVPHNW